MSAVVRPARPGEGGAVVPLYDWLFAPPGGLPPRWEPDEAAAALEGVIADPAAEVLLAEEDGEPLGFCVIYRDIRSVRYGPRAWVEDLAVHPGRRSRGTGKALLDAARAWARAHGASHLELDSSDARGDAHRFYEREGPSWRSRCFGWQL